MTRRLVTAFSVVFLPLFAVAAVAQSKGGQPGTTSPTPPPVVADAPACTGIPDGTDPVTCSCSAPFSGSVWGVNPYTGDSQVCAAARHAGVIGPDGGVLSVLRRPGQSAYEGSTANGITTGSWGAYGESFEILPAGAAIETVAPNVPDAPPCTSIPEGSAAQTCSCGANAPVGSVWGSNPYTGDSSICTAARHAGVIGAAGGLLKLIRRPGQASYDGTVANGVTTGSWGAYGESFEVLPASATTAESEAPWPACPGTLGAGVEALDCSCAAGLGDASVWGSDPYTADSAICTAARHAGYIDAGGGNVRVMRIRGLDSYAGSESNGVTSDDWHDYDSSIIFNWN